MIKFVNRLTHTVMWVADERKDEYLGAGHVLALESESAKPTVSEETPKRKKRGK